MAKILPLDPTTLPKRNRGSVYATQGQIITQRARVMPVLPRTNAQASATIGVAQVAGWWASLTSAEQLEWDIGTGLYASAYANFVQVNQYMATWGLDPFYEPPSLPNFSQDTLYSITSEPDQIHTTLTCYGSNAASLGLEAWVRLYINPSYVAKDPPTVDNGLIYVGGFGPLIFQTPVTFDITDLWNAIVGQWTYPNYYDPTADQYCGSAIFGQTADTDQYGRVSITTGWPSAYPDYYLGLYGGGIVPGACAAYPAAGARRAYSKPMLLRQAMSTPKASWRPLSPANRLVLARLKA